MKTAISKGSITFAIAYLMSALSFCQETTAHPIPTPAEQYSQCDSQASSARERNDRITTQRYRRSQHQYNARMTAAWRIYDDALETASEVLAAEVLAINLVFTLCTAASTTCYSVWAIAIAAAGAQYKLSVDSASFALGVSADEAQKILNADLDSYDFLETVEETRIANALKKCTETVRRHIKNYHGQEIRI